MPRKFFFFLSFIEGAAVMIAELIGAKMLSPQFGSSLYVWATVMAITLGGLACGYFVGGVISSKKRSPLVLYTILLIGSAFIILMPFLSKSIIYIFGNYSLIPSIIFCTFVFLFPPVFMMGMVSPVIVSLCTRNVEEAGRVSGSVYAISTAGGIIATFLTGFFIIPTFGLTLPCIITGISLGIIPLFLLIKKFKTGVAIWTLVVAWGLYKFFSPELQPGIPVPYNEEGMMGQVMVVDYPIADSAGNFKGFNRTLYVNRMTQAQLNETDSAARYFGYVDLLASSLSGETGKKVLICGMGGGGLANRLHDAGFSVDVCEIDPRISFVAKEYFKLNPGINVILDDARHFIKNSKTLYDIIVLDVFKGEEIPSHCFTKEAFDEMTTHLESSGMLIINSNGYIDDEKGLGNRSIAMTLSAAGYDWKILPTESNSEDWRNLEFFAVPPGSSRPQRKVRMEDVYIEKLPDGIVLTDDRPILDIINIPAYKAWRKLSIDYFTAEMARGRYFPLFK